MAVAKNPGVGQGKGGGRPRGRTRAVEEVRLRLSPQGAELLRLAAESNQIPAWKVVEDFLQSGQEITLAPQDGPRDSELPPLAQQIAREVVAFLEANKDQKQAATRVLHRAWNQAVQIARHDLKSTPAKAGKEQE